MTAATQRDTVLPAGADGSAPERSDAPHDAPHGDTHGDPGCADDQTAARYAARYAVPVTQERGQLVLHPSRDDYLSAAQTAASDGFEMCLDVCGVDALGNTARALPTGVTPERFEVVVQLLNLRSRSRLRLRVQVPEHDPRVPSLTSCFVGAEAAERETFDLFGIVFDGHPDLTRILLPEDWDGHPLRKDYAIAAVPVTFKAVRGR